MGPTSFIVKVQCPPPGLSSWMYVSLPRDPGVSMIRWVTSLTVWDTASCKIEKRRTLQQRSSLHTTTPDWISAEHRVVMMAKMALLLVSQHRTNYGLYRLPGIRYYWNIL